MHKTKRTKSGLLYREKLPSLCSPFVAQKNLRQALVFMIKPLGNHRQLEMASPH